MAIRLDVKLSALRAGVPGKVVLHIVPLNPPLNAELRGTLR